MEIDQKKLQAGQQRIEKRQQELLSRFQSGWQSMLGKWKEDGNDTLWLTYSANYLIRAANVRFAIDPMRITKRIPDAGEVDLDEFKSASFVVMTHKHGDHVDIDLLSEIAKLDHLLWVVPEHMLEVAKKIGAKQKHIKLAKPLEPISIEKIRITPFTGLHREFKNNKWGNGEPRSHIDSTGYLFEWDDKRLLLPGDTRTYDVSALPSFGAVDSLLGHTWLGRGAALEDTPPLLEQFCSFLEALNPTKQILLTHLWELGRGAPDYWDYIHTDKVKKCLEGKLDENIKIKVPDFFEPIEL